MRPKYPAGTIVSYSGKKNIISTVEYAVYDHLKSKWQYGLTGFDGTFPEEQVKECAQDIRLLPGTKVQTFVPYFNKHLSNVTLEGTIDYVITLGDETTYNLKGMHVHFKTDDLQPVE